MNANHFSRPSVLIPLLLFAALAFVPLVAQATTQAFYIGFFARILIYALAASALNLALGYGGLVSFGHALFFGIGVYCVGLPSFYEVDNGVVHLALCLSVCAGVAFVTGVISLRTSGIAFIMITLAFAQMGYFLFISLRQYGGDDGLPIAHTSRFGPLNLGDPTTLYYVALVVLAVVTWWMARLRVSPFGMALRGARQNARRVNAAGLQVLRYQLTSYVISGMLCGVAGMLFANLNAFASPSTFGWNVSGELIVMVVLGGMGSVFGALLGALAFLGLEEYLKGITEHWMIVFGPLIVVMSLWGKNGIVGILQRLDRRAGTVPVAPAKAAAIASQEGNAR
jgi:branched-chain amino acid transport system permease protein